MEWVKEFYDKQEKWTRCYTGPITEYHTNRVIEVEKVPLLEKLKKKMKSLIILN